MSPKQPKSAASGRSAAVTRAGAARPVAVILAAGLGTRMKSRMPKVLHPLLGRPMLAYVIDAARAATGVRPLIVYSPKTDAVREAFRAKASFALQKKPQGTGDALAAAVAALPKETREIVVLSGDVPLIEATSVSAMLAARRRARAAMAVAVMELDEPTGYGRIQKGPAGTIKRIVEEKDATPAQRAGRLINAGLYAFEVAWLRKALPRLAKSPTTGELYLTAIGRAGQRRWQASRGSRAAGRVGLGVGARGHQRSGRSGRASDLPAVLDAPAADGGGRNAAGSRIGVDRTHGPSRPWCISAPARATAAPPAPCVPAFFQERKRFLASCCVSVSHPGPCGQP